MAATPSKRTGKPSGSKLTLSIVLGMMLIPVSAVAAVMLTDHETAPAVAEDTTTTVALTQPPPSIAEIAYANVGATAEDLAYACGEGGLWLVEVETNGTITPVQQAALDALRGICEGQGTPLPGKPAPPPITQTRTVTVTVAPAAPPPAPPAEDLAAAPEDGAFGDASEAATETTAPTRGDDDDARSEDDDDHSSADGTSSAPAMGTAERYSAVHAQALAEIDHAVSEGGSLEKISEARAKLAEAERKASSGEYEGATTQAYEAIGKARESVGEGEDD